MSCISARQPANMRRAASADSSFSSSSRRAPKPPIIVPYNGPAEPPRTAMAAIPRSSRKSLIDSSSHASARSSMSLAIFVMVMPWSPSPNFESMSLKRSACSSMSRALSRSMALHVPRSIMDAPLSSVIALQQTLPATYRAVNGRKACRLAQ